jgi:DNA-binding YbaB/EbfC family protein
MAKGYNRGGSLGKQAGGGMMDQIKKLQEQLAQAQEELKDETVTVSAGGGAIQITMTGDQVCKAVELSSDLLQDADVEMLQDLLVSAINLAVERSHQLAEDKLGPLTGGMGGLGL